MSTLVFWFSGRFGSLNFLLELVLFWLPGVLAPSFPHEFWVPKFLALCGLPRRTFLGVPSPFFPGIRIFSGNHQKPRGSGSGFCKGWLRMEKESTPRTETDPHGLLFALATRLGGIPEALQSAETRAGWRFSPIRPGKNDG